MCDKVVHPSGEVDAVPAQVIKYADGYVCEAYAFPKSRERVGGCALCSIPAPSTKKKQPKLNPIKASKRK